MVHVEDVSKLMGGCAPHRIYTRTAILAKTYGTDSAHCTNECNANCIAINVNAPVGGGGGGGGGRQRKREREGEERERERERERQTDRQTFNVQ